jgi:predicted dithiol-disulfide oxidoreductase (DUF899 family)
MLPFTRLVEGDEYARRREELRRAEVELLEQRERVAAMRRDLPAGAVVDDYVFLEGPRDLGAGDTPVREVRMSELFTAPDRALVVYHLMYGKAQTSPCPMCTQWIDGFNGIWLHVEQNADFVVVAAADPAPLRAYARSREWNRARLLSCGDNTFKYDLRSEDADGTQDSTVSVFSRDAAGVIRHNYSAHPWISDEWRERGIDLLCPTWHLLDLTPHGRGEWYSSLDY